MVVFASDSNRLVQIFQTCPLILISIPKRNPKMTTFNTLLDLDYRKKGITFSQAWSHQNLDISLFLGWREACALHNWKGTQAIPGNKRNKLMRTFGDWGMMPWPFGCWKVHALRHVFFANLPFVPNLNLRICLELGTDLWHVVAAWVEDLVSTLSFFSLKSYKSVPWRQLLVVWAPGIADAGYENEWDLKFPQTRSNKVLQRCTKHMSQIRNKQS